MGIIGDIHRKGADMAHGPIGGAARTGDYTEVLRQSLVKVADMLDATNSDRDASALAIKVADLVDRIEAREGGNGNGRKPAEVSQFEVIAKRRGERRKAASG